MLKNIKLRHTLAVIPAFIFWAVSLLFFVMGLSFGDQSGWLRYIAFALALANTIIQLIGWDSEPEELGQLLTWTWYGSYVLGIGTNIVSLLAILQINNQMLEWIIAGSLGALIEITPERLFVLAWRSLSPKPGAYSPVYSGGDTRRRKKAHRGHQELGQTPPGMSRREYLRRLEEEKRLASQRNRPQPRSAQTQTTFKPVQSRQEVQPDMFPDVEEDDLELFEERN